MLVFLCQYWQFCGIGKDRAPIPILNLTMPFLFNYRKAPYFMSLLLKPFPATFVLTVYNGAPINMEYVFKQRLYLWFTEADMDQI